MKQLILSIALCFVLWPLSLFAQAPLYGGIIAPDTQIVAYGAIPNPLVCIDHASGGRSGVQGYFWQVSTDGVNWEYAEDDINAIREPEYQPGLPKQNKLYFR